MHNIITFSISYGQTAWIQLCVDTKLGEMFQQLKELEADGIVKRKLYPIVPPKTEYSLTERGKTLIPAIIELNKWGMSYLKEENIPCAYKEDAPINS